MSLRVMTFVGFLVLVVGVIMFWLTPATTSELKSVKPIGASALSHTGQPRSRMDSPDSVGSREGLDTQRGKR